MVMRGSSKTGRSIALPIEKEQPLPKELEHFADCVRENKKPLVAGEEGRLALAVALEIGKKIKASQLTVH